MSSRIDVHHHLLPAFYVKAAGAHAIGSQGSSGRVPAWSIEAALAAMEGGGIRKAITSFTAPGLATIAADLRAGTARECNEFAARMCRDYPTRFGMFATLPLPDVDATLREIEFAYDVLRCDGVCLLSNYDGMYLGDDHYHPVYEALERRRAVAFIHPTSPASPVSVGFSLSSLEFPFDTTRTAASLMLAGVPRRFPSVRFILSHAGGAIPYLVERLDLLSRNNEQLLKHAPNGFAAECGKFYMDTALSMGVATLSALRKIVPLDHVLFGTDYPFGPPRQVNLAVDALGGLPMSEADRVGIEHHHARILFSHEHAA